MVTLTLVYFRIQTCAQNLIKAIRSLVLKTDPTMAKKILLMGKAHSGKTSMRSIIFANYLARDTTRLAPTLDVEHHHVRFLGDLVLNLWDCGGQDAFYESYFERDRETIFRSVEVLIYVFDIESESPEKDFNHFEEVLTAITENSPDARVFVLVHKMDLVAEEDRDSIFHDRHGTFWFV
jgi:Ras-related GTP-binding protein A/B